MPYDQSSDTHVTPRNKEDLHALADRLENLEERDREYRLFNDSFNMMHWDTCIAGHACRMMGVRPRHSSNYATTASKWLGLDWNDSQRLFTPVSERAKHASAKQAASVLRHFAETGEIDWGRAVGQTQ